MLNNQVASFLRKPLTSCYPLCSNEGDRFPVTRDDLGPADLSLYYRLDFDFDLLDLGRLQRPNRNSFFPNLPIQHEFVYLIAVVKPRVPPNSIELEVYY